MPVAGNIFLTSPNGEVVLLNEQSWPGQACGYKVGHSEINRQSETPTAALGLRFDSKVFNDTLVLGGNMPLDLLAKNVDEYIQNTNKR